MLTQQELLDGQDFTFNYPGLINCVAHIQYRNSYLQFEEADGMVVRYTLAEYPDLDWNNDEIHTTCRMSFTRASGENIPLAKSIKEPRYIEYKIWDFLMVANLPISWLEFSLKQFINGLTRRLKQFGGDWDTQGGHMLFKPTGELVQPIVFNYAKTDEHINAAGDPADSQGVQTSQADGSITVMVVESAGSTFEYRLDEGDWQGSNDFTGLSAGTYFVQARDETSAVHGRNVTVGTTIVAV